MERIEEVFLDLFFLKTLFFSARCGCVFYCQRNSKPKRLSATEKKARHQHRHRHHPKISHEIYKSFSFIHLIAVFWHFPFISAHPFHSLARFSVCCFHTFRSFYWFESAKKLILLVIVRCFSFFSVCFFYFFSVVLFCFVCDVSARDDNKFQRFISGCLFKPC